MRLTRNVDAFDAFNYNNPTNSTLGYQLGAEALLYQTLCSSVTNVHFDSNISIQSSSVRTRGRVQPLTFYLNNFRKFKNMNKISLDKFDVSMEPCRHHQKNTTNLSYNERRDTIKMEGTK